MTVDNDNLKDGSKSNSRGTPHSAVLPASSGGSVVLESALSGLAARGLSDAGERLCLHAFVTTVATSVGRGTAYMLCVLDGQISHTLASPPPRCLDRHPLNS